MERLSPSSVSLGSSNLWVAGGGIPVMVVHGWGLSPAVYASAMMHLAARGYHVAAPELGVVGKRWTIDRAVHRVVKGLDAMGWDRAVLVGNSLGGAVSLAAAARHPKRTRLLVLVDSVGLTVPRTMVGWATPWRRYVAAGNLRAASAFGRNIMSAPGLVNLAGAARYAAGGGLDAEIEAVRGGKVPTAVMWGECDRLLPIARGRALAAALDAPLRVVPGADHDWTIRFPELFARELDVVLGRMLARGRSKRLDDWAERAQPREPEAGQA